MSSTQFRLAYHRMAEAIQKSADTADVAVALNLLDEPDESCRRKRLTSAMQNPLYGALVGVDLHPRQNVYQVRAFVPGHGWYHDTSKC